MQCHPEPRLAGNYPAAAALLSLLARYCLHLRSCADSKAPHRRGCSSTSLAGEELGTGTAELTHLV